MTMIDIGQFANIEINWYETKLIYQLSVISKQNNLGVKQ